MASKKIIKIKCEGTQYVDFHKLNEFQEDIKTITREDLDNLKESIITRGYIKPGFIWKHNKKLWILDMHQRLKALTELEKEGWYIPLIPIVEIFAKTVKEAKDAVLVFTSQSGKIDEQKLHIYIEKYQIKMKTLVIRNEPIKLDIGPAKETKGDDEIPEDVKPITKVGDLWELGKHRVLCGDSTDRVNVDRLMDGEKVDMVFTDPPYNVAKESKNYAASKSKSMKKLKEAKWDQNFDINKLFPIINKILKIDCTVYICTSQWLVQEIWKWMWKWSKFCNYIIWCKPNPMPSLSKRHWTWATEIITYAVKGKHISNFPNKGHNLNYWKIPKIKETDHCTEKPVKISQKAIEFSSNENQIIFDGFFGSGSTLIACEKTDRICYGMEIEPYYCDVIVKRYIDWCQKNNRPVSVKRNGKKFDINKFNLPAKQGVSRE